jgi:hypothetical protein
MESAGKDLLGTLLLKLGRALEFAARKAARSMREVATLCDHVAPDILSVRVALEKVGHSALQQHLTLLLDLDVPANLVKLMSLSLRAGYPMAQPSEAAKEYCEIASHMWALSSELFRELLLVCHTYPGEPNYELCKAVVDQLQPFTNDGDPGEVLACSCL